MSQNLTKNISIVFMIVNATVIWESKVFYAENPQYGMGWGSLDN
jgi:hypothetical protein